MRIIFGLFGILAFAAIARASLEPAKPKVEWLGSPTHVMNGREYHVPSVEIGLRDDGVVVWRERK